MRGHSSDDDRLSDFVAARTAELHRTAYLLTVDQDRAERLVEFAVAELRRRGTAVAQPETTARHEMARMAGAVAIPTTTGDDTADAEQAIARLSPRQRAVLMLRCVDGYDLRATARKLGLSRAKTEAAERSASQSPGLAVGDDELRTELADFAEHADWPDPQVTLTGSMRIRPPRRRSRTRYAAVAAVLALTAAAPIGSQVQHDHWLRTPAGINATHGTHFHAYTQGYKLVGVQRVPRASKRSISVPPGGSIALSCTQGLSAGPGHWATVIGGEIGGGWPCSQQSAARYMLVPASGSVTVRTRKSGDKEVFAAIYAPVPWSSYPVARDHFHAEKGEAFDSLAHGGPNGDVVKTGQLVTMTGRNGVFSKTIQVPGAPSDEIVQATVLFAPTTSGQYKLTIDGDALFGCGAPSSNTTWCRLYDRDVPRLSFVGDPEGAGGQAAAQPRHVVRLEVRDALAPWTLKIRFDRVRPTN